jgi:hypothetical protein
VKVVVSTASAVGASSAPNAPCGARANDEQAEGVGHPAQGGGEGEAEQSDDESALAPDEVRQSPAEQQERAEGQRVGRDDPLPVSVGELQIGLGAGRAMFTTVASSTTIS